MANPSFSGNVWSRRCETCANWRRLANVVEDNVAAFGVCADPVIPPGTQAIHTSDLTVCSNWTHKPGAE